MANAAPLPDREFLLKEFLYDPETGSFRRARFPQKEAGWTNECGYRRVYTKGDEFITSRIIWKMMTGDEPEEIDHKDRDRGNNRWDNLRSSDRFQNSKNKSMHSDNSIGYKGVYRNKKKFGALIMVNGKRLCLGSYQTPEEAHAAYCAAAQEHHGEFWSAG